MSPLPPREGLLLSVPPLAAYPHVHHGFSTRLGGVSAKPFDSLNLSLDGSDEVDAVAKNFEIFSKAGGFLKENLVLLKQVHGARVLVIGENQGLPNTQLLEYDAMVTDQKNKVLAIRTADCLPVLFLDEGQSVIGAAHAGWRGLLQGVVENTLNVFTQTFQSKTKDIQIAMGPGIGASSFEVGEEVFQQFCDRQPEFSTFFVFKKKSPKKWLADLKGISKKILQDCGVHPEKIFSIPLCTYERKDLFYSYRRDGTKSGRHLSFIRLK